MAKYGAFKTIFSKYLGSTIHHINERDEKTNIFWFCIDFHISWILKWEFNHKNVNNILVFLQCTQVKWWDIFDPNFLSKNISKNVKIIKKEVFLLKDIYYITEEEVY